MRFFALLLLLATLPVSADTGYHLQMQVSIGSRKAEPLAMTVAEGRTGTISVAGDNGFSLEVTVTPAAKNAKTGQDQVDVLARVFDQHAGKTTLLGEPLVKVPLGKTATIGVKPDGSENVDVGYYVEMTVSRTANQVDFRKWTQCGTPGGKAATPLEKLAGAKACSENCCCYACQGLPPRSVTCCNACCFECGSGCCAQ